MKSHLSTVVLLSFFTSIAVPSTAAAKEPAKEDQAAAKHSQKMCEDIIPVGSRIVVKRVCASRQEWQAKRRNVREDVDKAQQQRGLLGE